jgi:hypothetical protein
MPPQTFAYRHVDSPSEDRERNGRSAKAFALQAERQVVRKKRKAGPREKIGAALKGCAAF